MKIPFATNSYKSRSLPLSAQRCLNLFAEQAPQDARSPVILYGSPGLVAWGTIGSGPIRLLYEMAGILYAVSRDQLYRVSSSGVGTLIGTLAGQERTDYPLFAADNGTQLAITNYGTGQASVYDTATALLSPISDPDFPRASSCAYVDGYHVFARRDSGQWFISSLLDASSYDALDFATAETYPDLLVRVFVDHREVWLFGTKSTEIWSNTGAADFPFARISGTVLERGCGAAASVSKMDNSVYWLAEDGVVYRAAGYQPARISTHALEYAIEGYGDVSDAAGFTFTMEGHSFYVLTFPSAPATWIYDAATGLWHERESRDDEGRDLGRWRVSAYAKCYDRHICGDYETGALYTLDLDTGTEAGLAIKRVAVSPALAVGGNRMTCSRIELEMETGVGLTTGQGSLPQAMLEWSDDGGRSWSNEHWSTFGAIGAYRRRARWYRCGQFRERYIRLTISDPVKVAILGATAEMTKGQS
jgi:hypothetical protein